jgi:hypothetical protein
VTRFIFFLEVKNLTRACSLESFMKGQNRFVYKFYKIWPSMLCPAVAYGIFCHEEAIARLATLPPFGPIEGQKWFDQISSQ